jgi:hypothetical protein
MPLGRPRSKPKPQRREAQTNRLRKVKVMWPMPGGGGGAVGRRIAGFVVDNAALEKKSFSQSTSLFLCQYHSTNASHSFTYLSSTLFYLSHS